MIRVLTHFLFVFLFLASTYASVAVEQPLALRIDASLGGQTFAYQTVTTDPSGSYDLKLTDLRYYLSRIAVTHDGGQTTEITDVYVLVDLGNADQVYQLGSWDISNVESIRMSIGVDQANNHKDPTLWPPTHPLSPQLPTMHWGWSAGYRFCTLEGYAGAKGFNPATKFEVHSVGDQLYKTVTIDAGAEDENGTLTIQLQAEYLNLLTDIEANWGPISHGSTGESQTLMVNFTKNVFSAKVVASVREEDAAAFTIAPNPATDQVVIRLQDEATAHLRVIDVSGAVVLETQLERGLAFVNTNGLAVGAYTIVLTSASGEVSSRSLSILR